MNDRLSVIKHLAVIAILVSFCGAIHAQPTIAPGGVLNAASFDKTGQGLAPGSLVAIFGTGLGATQADADTVPFSTVLGGVRVTFNGVSATLRDVIPSAGIVNAEIPFGVLSGGQTTGAVDVAVAFNGGLVTQSVKIVPAAPGVFTIPSGVGTAILVNLTDFSVAAPVGKITGLTTHPIARGTKAFFYATGLGAMTPPVNDGDAGGSVTHTVNSTPIVWIGGVNTGVMASVDFAGQAPGFPGVYQVNITVPSNAPTGDGIQIQIQTADGSIASPATVATVSIQ
jgi:uncharacterized protein (TIGR03437 family)